ncbi:exosortase-associated EpsI family protein [Alienimonas californiensis]|uniref:Methanolan biosynthesis EpsI domain-containing protein n=1 Tax=Alienimonas californiensis TaxID=2527989 RepID=A0A517P4B5_9PLAN|nr:exosortase-associated EpsI family protein [Alienimonas californiensis]QDT14193.1 hypothetical protein CA12_02610 [Alienimonas californiensis]
MPSGSLTAWLHRLAPAAGVALLLGAGVAHQVQTSALRDPAVLTAAADRLDEVPLEIDGWTAEPLELGERQLRLAEATGGFARRYVGPNGEGPVEVMLLAGPQGPISVHPPTVCFRGAGYRQCSPVTNVPAGGVDGVGDFAAATFEKEIDGRPVRIRTHWAWGAGAGWSAPETPRVAFAGEPFLYKLYVTEFRTDGEEAVDDAPLPATRTFLNAFLPRLRSALAADAPAA